MLSRRAFLSSSAALAASALGPSRRPNVLVVIADEWRAQATSWNGDRNVVTPALDRFARESVSFDRAVSNLPVCCPARASMMTGQYPLTHRVFINDVELKPKGVTLGEAFRNAGYATGFIGKWHLYGSPDGNYGRRLAPIPREKRLGSTTGKPASARMTTIIPFTTRATTRNRSIGRVTMPRLKPATPLPSFRTRRSERIPSCSASRWVRLTFPTRRRPRSSATVIAIARFSCVPNVPEAKRAKAIEELRGYYAHMAALDACFARLFGALEQTGIADDTIVVFLSDHGDMMLSQGLTTKLYPWDESVRVPMLIRYPRALGRKGWRSSATFDMPDLMPTILSLAGLPIPEGVEGSVRLKRNEVQPDAGASLILLPVPITEARRYGFLEYRGLRTSRYTYVRSIRGPWLLYDNQEDPYQMHNLVEVAGSRALREQLNRQLDAELRRRNDEFLPAAEYLKQDGLTHYKEPNVPWGYAKSPWGDWESTNLLPNGVKPT